MESPDEIMKLQKLFSDAAKQHAFDSNVFERKILLEKCYKGREMSSLFLKGISKRIENIHDKLDDLEIRTYRDIVKELLNKDVYKIRYYIHIETYGDESSKIPVIFNRGGIRYNFRYYIH